jgi:uncharacterized protein
MAVFVLTQVNGPNYDESRHRREQAAWTEHAAYMDKLLADGFVIMGGPLSDGQHVLLILEAADEQEVAAAVAADPWRPMGILATKTLQRWDVWLDSRAATGQRRAAPA